MFPRTITFETPADLRAKYLQQLESRNAQGQLLSSMFNAAGNLTIRSRPVISNGQLLCPTIGAGGNGQAVEVPAPIVRYYTEPYSIRFVAKDLDAIV